METNVLATRTLRSIQLLCLIESVCDFKELQNKTKTGKRQSGDLVWPGTKIVFEIGPFAKALGLGDAIIALTLGPCLENLQALQTTWDTSCRLCQLQIHVTVLTRVCPFPFVGSLIAIAWHCTTVFLDFLLVCGLRFGLDACLAGHKGPEKIVFTRKLTLWQLCESISTPNAPKCSIFPCWSNNASNRSKLWVPVSRTNASLCLGAQCFQRSMLRTQDLSTGAWRNPFLDLLSEQSHSTDQSEYSCCLHRKYWSLWIMKWMCAITL